MRMIWNMKVIWNPKMASLIWWTRDWASSGSWWWTGKPGVLQSRGSQSQTQLRDWTELNWTDAAFIPSWSSHKSQESREAWHTNILLHWCVKQNYITLVNNMYVNMYVIRITSSIQEALQIVEKRREEKGRDIARYLLYAY